MYNTDFIYNELINKGLFTEEELGLVTGINGYNLETLNDCCRYRFAEDVEDVLGLEEEV